MSNRRGFTTADRANRLEVSAQEEWDVLVVGGGITGAGIVWDATLRGLKAILVEKGDFAWGTSSRSTKLIHGGLRYLKQGEINLVREVGKERALLYELAPHLVHPLRMLLPLYKGGSLGPFGTSIGLWLYDRLAGVRAHERRTMLTVQQTSRQEPLLRHQGLAGGGMYVEYMTDDARLTLDILRTAAKAGAHVFNYTTMKQFYYQGTRVAGAYVQEAGGREFLLCAKKVVNAAGPWVDHIRDLDGSKQGKRLFLTKGVHLVLPANRLPIAQSMYFDTKDGRMVFAIPRGEIVYVGTTDTAYDGAVDHPVATVEDRDYLLDAVNAMCPAANVTKADVVSSWVGLRPLIYQEGKGPSELSRKDEIFLAPSGLITIAGGKLTGFRKMAKKVIDLVCTQLQREEQRSYGQCKTDRSPIVGGGDEGANHFESIKANLINRALDSGVPFETANRWVYTYGCLADEIVQLVIAQNKGKDQSWQEAELLQLELAYAWEQEMICRADDFLIRRTGALYFYPEWFKRNLDAVISFLAAKQNWSEEECHREREWLWTLYREAIFQND